MKTTQELYGIDPLVLSEMSYKEAIQYKIHAAKSLITELQELHYMARDDVKIDELLAAIDHNQQLLDELKC